MRKVAKSTCLEVGLGGGASPAGGGCVTGGNISMCREAMKDIALRSVKDSEIDLSRAVV